MSLDQAAIETLVTIYCEAWDEADRMRRATLLRRVFEEQGIYVDPTVRVVGIDGLVDQIDKVAERYPGSSIVRTSPVDAHHGMLRFGWRKKLANGDLLAESVDFCILSAEGRLSLVVGFFGPLANRAGPLP